LGLTRLRAFLRQHRRIALDASVFIYQLEANPRYVALTDRIFAWLERSDHRAVASTITMTELLVQPYRDSEEQRVDEFYALLTTYSNLDWIAPDLEVADIAARLRATHRLRTPDALQAATAIRAQATGLVTNDPVFERVGAFETLVLDHLL
jgi:predicted nucleic acid-binding protein